MPHRIYLVEDHAVLRQALADTLAREPDLVLCGSAATAEEALDALADLRCDLVVTDLALPSMDGAALTERLAPLRPGLPVVVLSVHDDGLYERRAREAGARAFLSKRDAAATLVPTLRRVLDGKAA